MPIPPCTTPASRIAHASPASPPQDIDPARVALEFQYGYFRLTANEVGCGRKNHLLAQHPAKYHRQRQAETSLHGK